jgi:hypothetical protein
MMRRDYLAHHGSARFPQTGRPLEHAEPARTSEIGETGGHYR